MGRILQARGVPESQIVLDNHGDALPAKTLCRGFPKWTAEERQQLRNYLKQVLASTTLLNPGERMQRLTAAS